MSSLLDMLSWRERNGEEKVGLDASRLETRDSPLCAEPLDESFERVSVVEKTA